MDLPGRLRVRLRPDELGEAAFLRLSGRLVEKCALGSVTFSRLTGSLHVIYEGGVEARARALETIFAFEPGSEAPPPHWERPLSFGMALGANGGAFEFQRANGAGPGSALRASFGGALPKISGLSAAAKHFGALKALANLLFEKKAGAFGCRH